MTRAPFSPEQVESINGFQQAGFLHPFTCATEDCGHDLVAEADGMRCPKCDCRQDWVHDFMADGTWKPPGDWPFPEQPPENS